MKKNRREAFDKFEYEPSSEVWKNIEKNLPVKKKRRYFIVWLLPLLLVAGVVWKWNHKDKLSFNSNEKAAINYSAESPNKSVERISESKNLYFQNLHQNIVSNQIRPEKENRKRINLASAIKNKKNLRVVKQPSAIPDLNFMESKKLVSYNQANSVASNVANNDAENFRKLPSLLSFISIAMPEKEVLKRTIPIKPERILSHWSLYTEAGLAHSSFSEKTKKEEGTSDYIGIDRFSWGCGIGYDLNSRWRISIGISSITIGAGENSDHTIILNGDPGDPGKTYTIVSPSGDLNGSGMNFNLVYFGSEDEDLFPLISNLAPPQTIEKRLYFSTRKEFQLIQLPLAVTYKFSGGRLTPELGMTLSTEYLNKYAVFLNDKRLDYQYSGSTRKIVFSAGMQAGLCYALSRSWGLFMEAGYNKALNSLLKEESINPVSTSILTGITYRIGYRK